MIAGIRHTDLCVTDLDKSLLFYCSLLEIIGWKTGTPYHEIIGEKGERVIYLPSPNGFRNGALGLRQAERYGSVDRYQVGLHHLAFNAPDNESVDKVAEWATTNNVHHESGPENYYDGAYYALFLRDPDNIKIEVVYNSGLGS